MSEGTALFAAPQLLTDEHDTSAFHSGEPGLDDWLRERALDNLRAAASRTYVVCPHGTKRVVGFYALAMGQILNQDLPGSMRRNMPRHVPAVILGRLAVDREHRRAGLGAAMLKDAVMRSARAAAEVSARLIVVHALSTEAEQFYTRYGFVRLPVEAPTLALDLLKVARLSG